MLIFCGWEGNCWSALLPAGQRNERGGLTMEVEEDGEGQGYLQKEEGGDAEGEFAVEGFVSEEVHGEECAGAAPEGCEEQECGLGGAAA